MYGKTKITAEQPKKGDFEQLPKKFWSESHGNLMKFDNL
jgi:hypothetical protein